MAEVTALEAKGGEDGAENSEFTFLAAVESAPQFHCPVCGNRVRAAFTLGGREGERGSVTGRAACETNRLRLEFRKLFSPNQYRFRCCRS